MESRLLGDLAFQAPGAELAEISPTSSSEASATANDASSGPASKYDNAVVRRLSETPKQLSRADKVSPALADLRNVVATPACNGVQSSYEINPSGVRIRAHCDG
jgi:hypothetical protein